MSMLSVTFGGSGMVYLVTVSSKSPGTDIHLFVKDIGHWA
jgi:hypothetical protein